MWQVFKETCIPVLALLSGLYSFKYLDRFLKILLLQLGIYLAVVMAAYFITPGTQTNPNQWLYNVYIFLETVLLLTAAFFLTQNKEKRAGIIFLFTVFLVVFLTHITLKSITFFSSYAFIAEGITVLIVYGYIVYRETFVNGNSLSDSPVLWASLGLLIFFICNVPYFSLFDFLNKNYPHAAKLLFQIITDVLANVRYLLLAISFWLVRRQYLQTAK
jgi:hypothetical membrane protein